MNPAQFRNATSYISGGYIEADVTGTTIDAGQFRKVCMVAVNTGTNSPAGNIYIQHSAGIGEHPDVVQAIAMELEKLA